MSISVTCDKCKQPPPPPSPDEVKAALAESFKRLTDALRPQLAMWTEAFRRLAEEIKRFVDRLRVIDADRPTPAEVRRRTRLSAMHSAYRRRNQ